MSRTVLVTGASGFIGSHLSQALVERGVPRTRHDPQAGRRTTARVSRSRATSPTGTA